VVLFLGSTGATEEYDGSTWTAGGSMGTGRDKVAGAVEFKQLV
jgi:hypothetical protein